MSNSGSTDSDRKRLTRWAHEHGRSVLGYLLAQVRDPHVADDLLQEVFVRAWQARQRYEDTGRERAYLIRIADRLACDWARRPRHEAPLEMPDSCAAEPAGECDFPWQELVLAERREELATALASLSESQRRILLLHYYGSLSFAEIANLLSCPLNTALSHARRGILALRRILMEKVG